LGNNRLKVKIVRKTHAMKMRAIIVLLTSFQQSNLPVTTHAKFDELGTKNGETDRNLASHLCFFRKGVANLAKVYSPRDIDPSILKQKIIASIGYGYQGRRYSMTIKNQGYKLIVGCIRDSYYDQAVADGMEVYSIEEAAGKADIVLMLTGDEVQPKIFKESINGKLRRGKAIVFASGFNIHYGFIKPPDYYDTILVAPVTPAVMAVGVGNDCSGEAWKIALALAKVSRSPLHVVIESNFTEEVITDEFHAVDPSTSIMLAMFDILVEAGYSPEMAYFNTIGWTTANVEEVFQKRGCDGVEKALNAVSNTSRYEKLTNAPKLIDEDFKRKMREYLRKVENGETAKEWMLEDSLGRPVLNSMMKKLLAHPALKLERAMLARRKDALS
jgi:ketol-acid reductoisomerase